MPIRIVADQAIRELKRDLPRLKREIARQQKRAIIDARRRTLAEAKRHIRGEYTIKAGPLGRRIKAEQKGGDGFIIRANGAPLGLDQFAGTRQTKKGLTGRIKKTGPRRLFRTAFKAPSSSNFGTPEVRAFRRTSQSDTSTKRDDKKRTRRGRLPIRRLFGPDAVEMLREEERLEHLRDFAFRSIREQLNKRLPG